MALLTVSGISKQEKNKYSVKGVSFAQQAFQKIAIAGETGSGKSTLLKMIAGLVQPAAGEIIFENKKVIGPDDKLIPGHPGIAYLSQHFELRNNYWVHELLEMANKLTDAEAEKLFNVCQISHLLNRRTDQLSGGEKQRIALAKLLITSPRLLLLDEPFSNLDPMHKHTIKQVIHDAGKEFGITCLLVSHDAPDILSWADTILVMKDGEIIQEGTPQQVYQQPANEYCAGLFGEYNLIDLHKITAFAAIPGILHNGKQLLIRPEFFTISAAEESGLRGIVRTVLYHGSFYSLDVLVEQQLIRIKATNTGYSAGDTIRFSVSSADMWYL